MNHDGFAIETFEAGRGLWHARIRRADQKPVVIDGVLFPAIEVGFAWPDPEAAIEDAKNPSAGLPATPAEPIEGFQAKKA